MINPIIGATNIGTITLGTTPAALKKDTFSMTPAAFLAVSLNQTMAFQSPPAVASAAPHKPPMSAWLELLGRPMYQVNRFQMIPLASAQATVVALIKEVSTRPEPIVLATAVPISAPIKFHEAESRIACRVESALVATLVAMALAVSWKPLMYSNARAIMMTQITKVIGAQAFFNATRTITLPASRQRSTTFSFNSTRSLMMIAFNVGKPGSNNSPINSSITSS